MQMGARQSDQDIFPPDPLADCGWCDGEGEIEVVVVRDARGRERRLTDLGFENRQTGVMTYCPSCNGSGDEPELGSFDDPRL